jgi:3-dehydroquinate synthetase
LEASTRYGRYLHGEAIAIGQAVAARLSRDQLGMPAAEVDRITRLFVRAGLPVQARLLPGQRQRCGAAMHLDKKVAQGELRFVLAERVGRVRTGQTVTLERVWQALAETPAMDAEDGRQRH